MLQSGCTGVAARIRPVPQQPVDPWTAFLDWLQTILVPDWNGLIQLLPLLIIVGLTGPILSLLALYWFFVAAKTPRGKVSVDDVQPQPAAVGEGGVPLYPPNVPYCPTHALLYPPQAKDCEIDGEELLVRCPVDDTVRVARQEVCRTCGTRYQLGASLAPVVVRRRGQPPAGGAAVA